MIKKKERNQMKLTILSYKGIKRKIPQSKTKIILIIQDSSGLKNDPNTPIKLLLI